MKLGAPLALVSLALALTGCGSSSLSATQLRSGAGRICAIAQRRTARIPTPTAPSGGARYLGRGIAALNPELVALRTLHPPSDMAPDYRAALAATAAEVRALRSTVKGLRAGNDPVVAIKILQQRLAPLETRAGAAWRSLNLPVCAAG